MSRTTRERLADAALHLEAATSYADDGVFDEKTIDAICMRVSAGIEALNALSPSRRDQLFGDQWPAMWGMRKRIAHTYSRVEVAVIIATVREDLPEIRERIRAYLDTIHAGKGATAPQPHTGHE